MPNRELDKVRLEPLESAEASQEDGTYEDSADETFGIPVGEYESDVSYAEAEGDYDVDAIVSAQYRDSRKADDRGKNGWKGWHYKVMWSGYLKTASDTEESARDFGEGGLLAEFWKTYDGVVPKGKKEPSRGSKEEVHFAPDWLLQRWFEQTVPRRSFNAFARRREREQNHIVKVRKTDSDYYINKARLAKSAAQASGKPVEGESEEARLKRKVERKAAKKAAKRKAREEAEKAASSTSGAPANLPGPTTTAPSTSTPIKKIRPKTAPDASDLFSPSSPPAPPKQASAPANAEAGPSRLITQPSRSGSPHDSELALLDSDHEVDAVLGHVRRAADSAEEEEEIELPVIANQGASKRKRIVSSPAKPDATAFNDGESPPKQKKKKKRPDQIDSIPAEAVPVNPGAVVSSRPISKLPSLAAPTASATSVISSSKTDRLAALGKIPKVQDTSPSASIAEPAASTAGSDHFGEPQPGIFDPAPESEEEVEQIEDRQARDEAGSDVGSLFASASDDEGDGDGAIGKGVAEDLQGHRQAVSRPDTVPSKADKPESVANDKRQNSTTGGSASAVKSPAPTSAVAQSQPSAMKYALPTKPVGELSLAPPTPVSAIPTSSASLSVSKPAIRPPTTSIPPKNIASTSKASTNSAVHQATTSSGSASVRPPQPAVRPKYIQPTRLKLIDGLSDPEVNKQAKRLGRQASPTGQIHVPRALQATYGGLSPVNPLAGGVSPVHPTANSQPSGTALAPTGRSLASHAPIQAPRAPAAYNQSASAPAGPRGWSASAYLASRPPPPEPRAMPGGLSPVLPQPGPGQSPIWQQNANPSPPPSLITPTYNAASDPRRARAAAAVQIEQGPPLPSPPRSPPPPPPPAETLPTIQRRPSQQYPVNPPHDTLRRQAAEPVHEAIASCRLIAPSSPDNIEIACPLRLLRGTPSRSYRELSLQGFLRRARNIDVHCETLDAFCFFGQLRYGAQIIEWAKVVCADKEARREYDLLKRELTSETQPKIYAAYTETGPHRVDKHYAIVFADAQTIGFDSRGLDRGLWQDADLDVVAVLLALPLDSEAAPVLPNPVDPEHSAIMPKQPPLHIGPEDLAESYGLSLSFLESLGKKSMFRFGHAQGPLDDLCGVLNKGFQAVGMMSKAEGRLDTFLVENARLYSHVRSSTMANALPRRTTVMAFGPSLSLLPSQWKARTIWSTGGLVTFSPTFILRSPDKFAELIRIIRPAGSWAAYVIPAVIEWASQSWSEPARCPDPTKTFETLTRSLFLDQHLLRFSGSATTSGGGLAISICPPSIHQPELCARWMSWLKRITDETDFTTLVDTCRGVRPGDFRSINPTSGGLDVDKKIATPAEMQLELVDIEQSQVEDLAAMRLRPDLLPYRRYVYVGEMSLSRPFRERAAARGVEFVSPDDFVAVFSGAV